jgi:hypothetical protein
MRVVGGGWEVVRGEHLCAGIFWNVLSAVLFKYVVNWIFTNLKIRQNITDAKNLVVTITKNSYFLNQDKIWINSTILYNNHIDFKGNIFIIIY